MTDKLKDIFKTRAEALLKANASTNDPVKFKQLKDSFESHMASSAFEYDKMNAIHGSDLFKKAMSLKDQLLETADKSSLADIFWLTNNQIITYEEGYKLVMSTDNHDHLVIENNLKKMVEECGELTQIAMKIALHGIDSHNPKTGESNFELIQKEMTDVIASIRRTAKLLYVPLPDEMIDDRTDKLVRLFGGNS